jgi:hypothetical protein
VKTRRIVVLGIALLVSVNVALWLVAGGLAVPRSLAAYLFGPKLVRAEVLVWDGGGLHDLRVDRGRVVSVSGSALTLRERDGTIVTVQVAAGADVYGFVSSFSAIRRGMRATTVRDGGAAATTVVVQRR